MKKLEIEALADKLQAVLDFVKSGLDMCQFDETDYNLFLIAAEEIFVNIAHYAYKNAHGMVRITMDGMPNGIKVSFRDEGIPYNPLEKDDPELAGDAADREVGGMGIFMTKTIMDHLKYEYVGGCNVLTMDKLYKNKEE